METEANRKQKLALVYASLPSVEEIDQFKLIGELYDITVISSEAIVGYLLQNSFYENMQCLPLPDHDENTTFLPGLEKVLEDFDLVCVKERLGVYAYQVVKAKWRSRFRLLVLVDNLCPLAGEDITRLRTIRNELTAAADGFLVQTQAAVHALTTEGITGERLFKVAPVVERHVERSAALKAQALAAMGLAEDSFVIMYYGQIEWEENLLDLLAAMAHLTQTDAALRRRLRLVVCGIGSFASELKQRSLSLGIDHHVVYLAPSRESLSALLQAADCMFVSPTPARDRQDGDPFRLLTAMAHGLPVVAGRSPVIEETVGKHRLDYCVGSYISLAQALKKAVYARQLTHNIVQANLVKPGLQAAAMGRFAGALHAAFAKVCGQALVVERSSLDHQVLEIESKVANQQYLAAIEMIEGVFHLTEVPKHHRSNLYRLIGDCFTKLGDRESGKHAYLQAIEIDPYSAKAHIGLGTLSLMKHNYDIGVIHFQKAVGLAPNDEMANLGLGLAFQGLDEVNEANKWVMKALAMNPENTAAIYTIVKLAQEREEYGDAEKALRLYLARHPHDHSMLYTLGGVLYQLKKYEDVVAAMQVIVAINPMDGRAQTLIKQAKRALDKSPQSSAG